MDSLRSLATRVIARTLPWVDASPWRGMAISFGSVGAIALMAISPSWDRHYAYPQATVQPRPAPPTASRNERVDASTFMAFALNALLIPVLDDDVPPRWTEPFALMSCVGADLMIDGKPVVFGSPVPATAFSMRWSMNQCTALGEAFLMSGTIDLLVFHDGDSYSAVVQPTDLRLTSSSGSVVLSQSFAASTPLGTWSAANLALQTARSRWQSALDHREVSTTRSDRDSSRLVFPSGSLSDGQHQTLYQATPAVHSL